MGVIFALFHARGTLAWVNDLLSKLVIGVSNCAQHSLSSRGENSTGPICLNIFVPQVLVFWL